MLKKFGKLPTKKSTAPLGLYIGHKLPEAKVAELFRLAQINPEDYSKPSNAVPYNGSAIFLDILGSYLASEGVPEQTVREFINSLQ